MGDDGAAAELDPRGQYLRRFVPEGPPSAWSRALIGDVVSWAFLAEVDPYHRVRPWLILEHRESTMGPVSVAVPRLMPESGWKDAAEYLRWVETTWQDRATPQRPALTVAAAAGRLPRGPTRPRWANPDRLVSVAVRADLEGRSSTQIVKEDGEGDLPSDRARAVRKEIVRARTFLAMLGALPWAAFEDGRLAAGGPRWWKHARFVSALATWRAHATDLSWRHARENPLPVDPLREAARVLMRHQWQPGDPLMLAHARGLLADSAREFGGSREQWLEGFIAWEGQTPECRADLVQRANEDGSITELCALWEAAKAAPARAAS